MTSAKGANPFAHLTFGQKQFSDVVKCYDPVGYQSTDIDALDFPADPAPSSRRQSPSEKPTNGSEDQAHLEFIQAIITRMGDNSFMVKGWCVTLISAIDALAAKDASPGLHFGHIYCHSIVLVCHGFFVGRRTSLSFSVFPGGLAITETDFDLMLAD